jgi:hypothetical protein
MSITVEFALGLLEQKNVSLAAGKAGLLREISSVNVMEVPDISMYLKPGVLLITTMYPIRNDEAKQRKLIPMLVEKEVTALAIAPLSELGRIPDFMLQKANETGLPVLNLPYGTSFDDIMNMIFQSIIENRYRSGLLENILQGNITSLPRVIAAGKSYGWNLGGPFIPVITRGSISIKPQADVIIVELNGNTLLLFPLNNISEAKKRKDEILNFLEEYKTVRFGMGRAIENIMELPKGYAQADQALKTSQEAKGSKNIVCYDDIGVHRVLFSSADVIDKQSFINDYLGPILKETELILTLRAYFDNHGNHRNTAKALNVHYNTISYRMNRIEQLAGLNLNNPDDVLCMQIALKLLDIIHL